MPLKRTFLFLLGTLCAHSSTKLSQRPCDAQIAMQDWELVWIENDNQSTPAKTQRSLWRSKIRVGGIEPSIHKLGQLLAVVIAFTDGVGVDTLVK